MQSIQTKEHKIHFNENCYTALNQYLKNEDISNIFILVDDNTHQFCLNKFLPKIETDKVIEIIEIDNGEEYKTLDTCLGVWRVLSELGADRKSLMLNLGGGVITDLGGFVASTFRRGIKYINVPTSLLAMVDASIGGKTGVDLDHLKNQVGVINNGDMVLIDTSFLDTLPQNQFRSGMAEMLKHGLISSTKYWKELLLPESYSGSRLDSIIYDSVLIKHHIVIEDPTEKGLRKALNFGHTLGHAIETYFLSAPQKKSLLHGEAIAIGMILESYLSHKLLGFPENDLNEITNIINKFYELVPIDNEDHKPIIDLLKFDKKNEHGNINFVLLNKIGSPEINYNIDNQMIIKSFEYYNKI